MKILIFNFAPEQITEIFFAQFLLMLTIKCIGKIIFGNFVQSANFSNLLRFFDLANKGLFREKIFLQKSLQFTP